MMLARSVSSSFTGTSRPLSIQRSTHGIKRLQVVRVSAYFKLLSAAEVPAFIPRDDLIDQLAQWADTQAGGSGARNFGLPMKVDRVYREVNGETKLWGFTVSLMRGGSHVCDLAFQFDTGELVKHEWISKDANGMPIGTGKQTLIAGKNFEIWKADEKPVTLEDKAVIKRLCVAATEAMNKYYTFGSVYSEEI